MINNLLSVLNFENIYLIANLGVIPFWLLLIILPHNQITNFFVQSAIVPLLLAGAYVYLSYNIYLNGEITETNLLEQKNICKPKKIKERYFLKLKPFEIKTFKVKV